MTNPPRGKFDDATNGKDNEKGLRKQTFKLSIAAWQELEKHVNAIADIVKNAQSLDPSELNKGSGLPAITYRGCVFAMDPDELAQQ